MPSTPILVGVADIKNPSLSPTPSSALEPAELMLRAIHSAISDTGLPPQQASVLQSRIEGISVVRSWTWPYEDLPGLLASKLGAAPSYKHYSEHGGNQPAKLLDEAARRIAWGGSRVAVVTGGEALASLAACAKAGKMPPEGWTETSEDIGSASPLNLAKGHEDVGTLHSVGLPIHVYPMYENAFRAHRGQSIEANHLESARLYGEFARVAARNPNAWSYGRPPATESEIAVVSKSNRMICLPYPLLMNAFNIVNLAAACVLTSTEVAEELGIPHSKWIYLLGGAGTRDSIDFWERPNFHSSPSISRSLDAAIEASGLAKGSIDLFDFYSCFPIVPKLACHHLGLPLRNSPKPVTLLGGLTSFGGAGNNYSMHAVTEMVRQLRDGRGTNGLVLANGGVATYQHVALPNAITDVPAPLFTATASGEAIIETYTVEYKRDRSPSRAHIVGRLRSDGSRFIANSGDTTTLQQLTSQAKEPIGKSGHVRRDPATGRNLFNFSSDAARL